MPLAPGDLLWLPEAFDSSPFFLPRYLNNQVFVSLANGELVVYQREAGEHPALPHSPGAPGWCGSSLLRGWGFGALSLEMWLWAAPSPSLGLSVLVYKWGF